MDSLHALRRPSRVLAVLGATVAVGGGGLLAGLGLPAASAKTIHAQQSASANWAGYVVNDSKFSSASGSWVVPSAKSPREGYSATWVGLGGASRRSRALEQVGTEADSVDGHARYYAWYELVPAASVHMKLGIHAGDHVSARVSVSGTTVTVSLSDLTTGNSVTKTLHMSDPDTSSAEWIVEAPSAVTGAGRYRLLPLSDFGKVTFTNASATADGHTGSIADPRWSVQKVRLVSSVAGALGGVPGSASGSASARSSAEATASSLTSQGSSFSVLRNASGMPRQVSF